jgi:hypothetical protein
MQDKIFSQNSNKAIGPVMRKTKVESVTRYVVNNNYVRNCPRASSSDRIAISVPRLRFLERPE